MLGKRKQGKRPAAFAKFGDRPKGKKKQQPPPQREVEDEEILSDEVASDIEEETQKQVPERDDPSRYETPDEKRHRLAKEILREQQTLLKRKKQIEDDDFFIQDKDEPREDDEEEEDEEERRGVYEDAVTKALQEKIKKKKQMVFKEVAAGMSRRFEETDGVLPSVTLKGHKRTITGIELDPRGKFLYSISKDSSIIKWDLNTSQKLFISLGRDHDPSKVGHYDEILCLSVNYDGRYLVTAGKDRLIHLWDTHNQKLIDTMKGHRDTIQGIKFKLNSNEFCTVSSDRTLKLWDAAERAYMDTFYGHQAEINGLDVCGENRMISCGFDRKLIVWKLEEESQLIYGGHDYSIDCVKAINPNAYLSGSQDGNISLWSNAKKKPIYTLHVPHGEGNWITALGHYYNTDVAASGSKDGKVNFFSPVIGKESSLKQLFTVPSEGIVNDIQISSDGDLAAWCEGGEPRLGRWFTTKCKDQIKLLRFQ
eukprot:TRINITY_DN4869_c0_g1_i1.p1 TRINITY_DN4869_c0_g1~~TRINITY_DN4869_c0_g1_i1.p1  ORF type:complete len:480 (-),score=129.95 TRINITY_DN4869_c0_g1_i1:113-1552(-)